VNINNDEKHSIAVYVGDRPEQLARVFAEEQQLDQDVEGKLAHLIRCQMDVILTRIDEVTDNSSCSSFL